MGFGIERNGHYRMTQHFLRIEDSPRPGGRLATHVVTRGNDGHSSFGRFACDPRSVMDVEMEAPYPHWSSLLGIPPSLRRSSILSEGPPAFVIWLAPVLVVLSFPVRFSRTPVLPSVADLHRS